MVINCVIPGGQRCGSTYLSSLISKFDSVRNPITESAEPKWFLTGNRKNADRNLYMKEVFGIEGRQTDGIYLEKSTSYLSEISSATRIKETLGNIPIVVVLRNPVARAISHFRFSTNHGFEILEFDKAIYLHANERTYAKEKVSANPFRYIENSLYIDHLKKWLSIFPDLKIIFLEDLMKEPSTFIEICEYLGLNKESGKAIWNSRKINQSSAFPGAIYAKEVDYLQTVFLEPNRMLQKLLDRNLPAEWSSPFLF